LCLLPCLFSSILLARTPKSSARTADPFYSSALAAANRFLYAWQMQDHETTIMMLSDAARERVSRERLQEFFSPGPRAAFEIQRGRPVRDGEYVFPVVLFGLKDGPARPHEYRLVIMRTGKDEWMVNRLP
jgi:hypothetical protein